MNDLLSKLIAKKGADDDMDPQYRQSKMAVLSQLMQEMSKMEAGGLATPKKVVVAAPDAAGLSAGLAKAQDLVDPAAEDDSAEAEDEAPEMDGGDHAHEAEDSDPEAASGMSHTGDDSMDAMSPEDLQAQIQKLQALLAAHSLK